MPVDPYEFEEGVLVTRETFTGEAVRVITRLGRCRDTRDGQVETTCVFYQVISHPWYSACVKNDEEFCCTVTSMKNWGQNLYKPGEKDLGKYKLEDYLRAVFYHFIEERFRAGSLTLKDIKDAMAHYLKMSPREIGKYQGAYKRLGPKILKKKCPNTKLTAQWMIKNIFIDPNGNTSAT